MSLCITNSEHVLSTSPDGSVFLIPDIILSLRNREVNLILLSCGIALSTAAATRAVTITDPYKISIFYTLISVIFLERTYDAV